jgi:hypothetical protein
MLVIILSFFFICIIALLILIDLGKLKLTNYGKTVYSIEKIESIYLLYKDNTIKKIKKLIKEKEKDNDELIKNEINVLCSKNEINQFGLTFRKNYEKIKLKFLQERVEKKMKDKIKKNKDFELFLDILEECR